MISWILINSDVENLRRLLIKLCYWYYVKAEPLMRDRDYDRHFDHLKELESIDDATFKPTPDSPTQKIWGDGESQYPEWAKDADVHHLYTREEIEYYEKSSKNEFLFNSPLYKFL